MRRQKTPRTVAHALRGVQGLRIPSGPLFEPGELTAYDAAKIVQAQCECSFRVAALAVQAEIPELFAGYWQAQEVRA